MQGPETVFMSSRSRLVEVTAAADAWKDEKHRANGNGSTSIRPTSSPPTSAVAPTAVDRRRVTRDALRGTAES